jgi:hypothetical protein
VSERRAHGLLPSGGTRSIGGAGAGGLGLLLGSALAVAELEAELYGAIRSTGTTARDTYVAGEGGKDREPHMAESQLSELRNMGVLL